MSLIVLAAVAAGLAVIGGAAGAMAARRARKPRALEPPRPALPEYGLPLQVGDVVVRGKRELWLTGALVLLEGPECRAALFLAPESSGARPEAVAIFPGSASGAAWVELSEQGAAGAIVADTLEGSGETLTRVARIPIRIEVRGTAPGGLEATGTWTRYEAPSGAIAFLLEAGVRLMWRGAWLLDGEWTRLAAGEATLRER